MDGSSLGQRTTLALFRRTAQAMVSQLVERLADLGYTGVSPAHHPLFENIDPEGTRLTVLAARAEMTHQSMGEMIQTLEDRGFVERRPDPSDRRARLVFLTPAGRKMVSRAVREMARIEREWSRRWAQAGLDGDVKSALNAALEALRLERRADASAERRSRVNAPM